MSAKSRPEKFDALAGDRRVRDLEEVVAHLQARAGAINFSGVDF